MEMMSQAHHFGGGTARVRLNDRCDPGHRLAGDVSQAKASSPHAAEAAEAPRIPSLADLSRLGSKANSPMNSAMVNPTGQEGACCQHAPRQFGRAHRKSQAHRQTAESHHADRFAEDEARKDRHPEGPPVSSGEIARPAFASAKSGMIVNATQG